MELGTNLNLESQLHERLRHSRPGLCCNIVYTSGTTEDPKGVMLSHDNMLSNMVAFVKSLKSSVGWKTDGSERQVSHLSLSQLSS